MGNIGTGYCLHLLQFKIKFIKAKAVGLDDNYPHAGFVEPKTKLLMTSCLLIESSLCHTDGKHLPVKVVNLSDEPVTLYKNKVLGTLSPVDIECDAIVRCVTATESNIPIWRDKWIK